MEKYFTLLAEYNRRANEAMYEILSAQSKEELTKECGSYYRSIDGIVRHLCQSDLTWLSRIKAAFDDFGALSGLDAEGLSPQGAPDLPALRNRRMALDQLFEKLAAELTDAHLSRELVYIDGRGNERRYILWQAMVHIFNHQTHHRGGIAEILDERGITNDYSNIVWYIKAPG